MLSYSPQSNRLNCYLINDDDNDNDVVGGKSQERLSHQMGHFMAYLAWFNYLQDKVICRLRIEARINFILKGWNKMHAALASRVKESP